MSLQIIYDGTVIFDEECDSIEMMDNVRGELKLEASFQVQAPPPPLPPGTRIARIGTEALAEILGLKWVPPYI